MKKHALNYVLIALFGSAMTATAQADATFQNEASVSYFDWEIGNDAFNISALTGSYRHYHRPVSTTGFPWNEAGFLSRTSDAEGHLTRTEIEIDLGFAKLDANGLGYGLGYTHRDSQKPMTFTIAYEELPTEDTVNGALIEAELQTTTVGVGIYVRPHTHVSLTSIDREIDLSGPGGSTSFNFGDSLRLAAKHFQRLDTKTSLILQGHYTDTDYEGNNETTTIGFLADYYIDNRTNAGIGYETISGDGGEPDGDRLTIRGNLFLDPWNAGGFEYTKLDSDATDSDERTFLLTYRRRM